jgi:hypothetical protein
MRRWPLAAVDRPIEWRRGNLEAHPVSSICFFLVLSLGETGVTNWARPIRGDKWSGGGRADETDNVLWQNKEPL